MRFLQITAWLKSMRIVALMLGIWACQTEEVHREKLFISVIPSKSYLDSIQQVTPASEWTEIVSDNNYYMDVTRTYLLAHGYKEMDLIPSFPIRLQLANGNIQTIDIRTVYDEWGTYVFNGKDSAFLYTGIVPDREIQP